MTRELEVQLAELKEAFEGVAIELTTGAEIATEEACLVVQRSASLRIHNVTGRLSASITHRLIRSQLGVEGQVGTNVYYGPYVEFGTTRSKPYPFLRPALKASQSYIKEIFKRRLKEAL